MTVHWGLIGLGALFATVSISVLRRVYRSLRTGVNDWTDFGPVRRAPYEYDFWVVNFLFGAIALVFLAGSFLMVYQAFQ